MSFINELFDVIVNNPIEAFLLLAITIFAYKFFLSNNGFARETRHDFKRWLEGLPFDIYWFLKKCVNNPYSYCNLQHEKFEQVIELIKITPTMHYWNRVHFIKAKLEISGDELEKILKALKNLQITSYDQNDTLVINDQRFGIKVSNN